MFVITLLSFTIEFEFFSSDLFLTNKKATFLLMISSISWLFFFSFSLNTLISGLGKISAFLGRGGISVLISMMSALYSYSFLR